MSDMVIRNGEGIGYYAGVTAQNRFKTSSQNTPIPEAEALKGNAYNINTLEISISADSALIYLKNTGTKNIVIAGLFYNQFQATAGKVTYNVVFNPTAGTIIDDETAVGANANRFIGSPNALNANIYKGANGKTFSDGTTAIQSTVTGNARVPLNVGAVIIPQGKSIGVKVETTTASTISVAIACYEQNEEV